MERGWDVFFMNSLLPQVTSSNSELRCSLEPSSIPSELYCQTTTTTIDRGPY